MKLYTEKQMLEIFKLGMDNIDCDGIELRTPSVAFNKALSICGVVSSLPSYKEAKIECEKQFKEMNETYAFNLMTSEDKRVFTSGFIRCFMFMKSKR